MKRIRSKSKAFTPSGALRAKRETFESRYIQRIEYITDRDRMDGRVKQEGRRMFEGGFGGGHAWVQDGVILGRRELQAGTSDFTRSPPVQTRQWVARCLWRKSR